MGSLFAQLIDNGQDWIERMVLIASETSAFENTFHVIMSVAMNMVPNFWSEMVGVVTGFILPEVLIEIVLAVIAALTGAGVALLAGRFVAFIAKLRGMARKAASLGVLADILDAFRKAIAALAKIGKGLHDELEAATRAGADGVARIHRRLNQYKIEIDPNTLGMNGGNIIIRPKGKPHGRRTDVSDNHDAATRRSLERENDSADILAKEGYDVEQNPSVPGNKNPDYKVNGEIYDNYAPSTDKPRNIWSEVEGKITSGQTENVVLNLQDSPVDLNALRDQFSKYPISGLKDVIVIYPNGSIGGL